jgi:hypothetical protein
MENNDFDAMFTAVTAQVEAVTIPEYKGQTVFVRVMTGEEREAYEMGLYALNNDDNKRAPKKNHVRALLVSCTLCDATGVRKYGPEDAPKLAKWDWRVLHRIASAAMKLNELSEQAVEDIAKN